VIKASDFIENRTRDLPDYSVVPQATTLPRAYEFQKRSFPFILWKVPLLYVCGESTFLYEVKRDYEKTDISCGSVMVSG
jgi:hypothetical protein